MRPLVFYTKPQSRGRIAHWMLEEIGQPYETRWLEYGPSGTKSEAYLQVNPMGKLPAITHGGRAVTETPAICAYLAASFPEQQLMPAAHSPGLADYYRWLFFAAGPLEQSITVNAMGWEVSADRRATVGFGSHQEVLDAISLALRQGPFVCGEQFTAADVYLASHLNWGMLFGGVEPRPEFAAYVAQATDRPAYRQANQINERRLADSV